MISSATKTRNNTPAAAEDKKPAFSALTRCDHCRAQAYVRAEKVEGDSIVSELFFCIHHGDKYQAGLISQGFDIDDRRWALR